VDEQGAHFLQAFINDMFKAMVAPPGLLPDKLRGIICPSPWDAGKDHLQPLPMAPNWQVDTSQVFKDDPISAVVKSSWRAIATGVAPGAHT